MFPRRACGLLVWSVMRFVHMAAAMCCHLRCSSCLLSSKHATGGARWRQVVQSICGTLGLRAATWKRARFGRRRSLFVGRGFHHICDHQPHLGMPFTSTTSIIVMVVIIITTTSAATARGGNRQPATSGFQVPAMAQHHSCRRKGATTASVNCT